MSEPEKLERGLGLIEATSLNMTFMVGIGPFIVIPLIVHAMGGPQCILAWVVGAVLAALDGCVWAELGAAMPQAGGSYVFLREAYGAKRLGRLMSFLFIWQTLVSGAAEHFFGRAGVCGLFDVSGGEDSGGGGVAAHACGICQPNYCELRPRDCGCDDRDCGVAAVPADHGDRKNFDGIVGDRAGNNFVADLWRGDAF